MWKVDERAEEEQLVSQAKNKKEKKKSMPESQQRVGS